MYAFIATAGFFLQPMDESDQFFLPTNKVQTIRVEVDKDNLKAMRAEPRKYFKATLRMGDEIFENVGIHLKGAAGSNRDWNDKPALTINSDKFKSGQTFHGLDKFHLNNSVQDEAYMNEILFGELFRAERVPTPRSTHVFVELNGRKVGLYVLREGFDRTFLKRHFKNNQGSLYDGGFLMDIDQNLHRESGTTGDWKDLKALHTAATKTSREERFKEMEKLLDVDRFASLWAIEVMGCDWDGYTRNRNNYRVYHDPVSDKLVFLAHGKDQMFQNPGDALVHGWGGVVAAQIWKTEAGRKLYVEKVNEILARDFRTEDLHRRIDEWTLRLKDPLNNFQKGAGDQYLLKMKWYKGMVKARVEFLKKEVPKLKP